MEFNAACNPLHSAVAGLICWQILLIWLSAVQRLAAVFFNPGFLERKLL